MNNSRKWEGMPNVIGNRIKYYRKLKKISLQKLSDMLMLYGVDIHKQAIYYLELGKRTVVDYEICAIAKCLDIKPGDLLEDYFNELDKEENNGTK